MNCPGNQQGKKGMISEENAIAIQLGYKSRFRSQNILYVIDFITSLHIRLIIKVTALINAQTLLT